LLDNVGGIELPSQLVAEVQSGQQEQILPEPAQDFTGGFGLALHAHLPQNSRQLRGIWARNSGDNTQDERQRRPELLSSERQANSPDHQFAASRSVRGLEVHYMFCVRRGVASHVNWFDCILFA
jgi:hypothetical protein